MELPQADPMDVIGPVATAIGGPLVGGGLALLGGLFQEQGQEKSIASQQAFQERMSSSAYQRATADMRASGLNPALMYSAGGPESTPSGASMMPPNVLGQVASSAMDAMRLKQDAALNAAQVAKTLADTHLTENKVDITNLGADAAGAARDGLRAVERFVNEGYEKLHGAFKTGAPKVTPNPRDPLTEMVGDAVSGISKWWAE